MKTSTLAIIGAILLASCGRIENPYKKYCESQIVEKASNLSGKWFRFRTDEGITKRVYVMPIDYDAHEVGEYLHCN